MALGIKAYSETGGAALDIRLSVELAREYIRNQQAIVL